MVASIVTFFHNSKTKLILENKMNNCHQVTHNVEMVS